MLRGLLEIIRGERTDQNRIPRQQRRHDGISLQLAHQVARVKRLTHFGAVAGLCGVAFGQKQIGDPDDAEGHEDKADKGHTPGPAHGAGLAQFFIAPDSIAITHDRSLCFARHRLQGEATPTRPHRGLGNGMFEQILAGNRLFRRKPPHQAAR